jgi:hypothetical protein
LIESLKNEEEFTPNIMPSSPTASLTTQRIKDVLGVSLSTDEVKALLAQAEDRSARQAPYSDSRLLHRIDRLRLALGSPRVALPAECYPHSLWSPVFATDPKHVSEAYEIHAAHHSDRGALPFKDDTYGELWAVREPFGAGLPTTAIIRAVTWKDAFQIYEDELAPESDPEDIPTVPWSEDSLAWQAFDEENRARPNGGYFQVLHDVRIWRSDSPRISMMVSHYEMAPDTI